MCVLVLSVQPDRSSITCFASGRRSFSRGRATPHTSWRQCTTRTEPLITPLLVQPTTKLGAHQAWILSSGISGISFRADICAEASPVGFACL